MVDRSLHYLNEIPISELKGFGEKRVKSLHKSGIKSVTDLIRLFPKKYKPYVIGKITKNSEKVKLSGKVIW